MTAGFQQCTVAIASVDQVKAATRRIRALLLKDRNDQGWWTGQLSTSALSTATACMALQLAISQHAGSDDDSNRRDSLLQAGLQWLANHQNQDGGWGDTVLSISNISTTMLAHAVLVATKDRHHRDFAAAGAQAIDRSGQYINQAGGVDAVLKRYGRDHTFSVPILTHCALAGIVDWKRVIPLPFELACVPARFYAAVRMPVVSYALPALIAIGQVIFRHRGHWNPLLAMIRKAAIKPTLRVLESIQPPNGGFLEATPLTSFVCMSLLGCGLTDHRVTQRCLQFIEDSVREDGSWPIDTNLTTWVTTLSVNALAGHPISTHPASNRSKIASAVSTTSTVIHAASDSKSIGHTDHGLQPSERDAIREWLLNQQYKTIHPYTNAAPGGWSWTDLPGGVPDADDTPGAMLAVMNLRPLAEAFSRPELSALQNAAVWLLDLQNRDGGWPTFCRGWGTLPFDRSSCDLTAHAMRALQMWQDRCIADIDLQLVLRAEKAINRGLKFLQDQQRSDGTWLPLWFGHQFHQDDENPLYGTTKVLIALSDLRFSNRVVQQTAEMMASRAANWITSNQNDDGGWSACRGLQSSVEETGLALEALSGQSCCRLAGVSTAMQKAASWLCTRVNAGTVHVPTPIGFYFAKLWYFEALYPTIFATAGLIKWQQWAEMEGANAEIETS